MASSGQVIEGPNIRLKLIETGAETGGELLTMEANYAGDGVLPPPHLHPQQAEHFEVLEGAVRTIVEGSERIYRAGESFDVPAATVHQMTGAEPSRIRWEVRPALRTAEFFERLYGALSSGGMPEDEYAAFFAEFSDEFQLAQD